MYTNTMTGQQFIQAATGNSNAINNALANAKVVADKFAALTYGMDNPAILALPQFATNVNAGGSGATGAWTESDLTAFKYNMGVYTDLYNALNNLAALPQANRFGYIEPFL